MESSSCARSALKSTSSKSVGLGAFGEAFSTASACMEVVAFVGEMCAAETDSFVGVDEVDAISSVMKRRVSGSSSSVGSQLLRLRDRRQD